MAGGWPSLYTAEERAALLKAWEASGLSAPDFAARHEGLRPAWLHQWRWRSSKPGFRYQASGKTVILKSVTVDLETYEKLTLGALEASKAAGRQVTVVAFAGAVLRTFLTDGAESGTPGGDEQTQARSGGGKKGGRVGARRGSQAGQPRAGAAARRAGPAPRKGPRRRPRAGAPSAPPGPIRGTVTTTRPVHQFEYQD